MALKRITVALLLCGATLNVGQVLCAQMPDAGASAPLTSKDYLKLMEQANAAAGIQPTGGNFAGAKPRPQGSLEIPSLQKGPMQPNASVAPLPPAQIQTTPPVALSASTPGQPPRQTQITGLPPGLAQNFLPAPAAEQLRLQQTGPGPLPSSFPGSYQPIAGNPGIASTDPVFNATKYSSSAGTTNPTEQVWMDSQDGQDRRIVGSGAVSEQVPPVWNGQLANPPGSMPMESYPQSQNPWMQPQQSTAFQNQPAERAQVTKTWTGPRWLARYATLSMRRPGDESMSFGDSVGMGTFGSDQASDITIGYMTNPIDCYEFNYLGSLNWVRNQDLLGPIATRLTSSDSDWISAYQDADSLKQSHNAGLRQYGLSRRWMTDDIGNSSLGLRVIDYSERYRLQSVKASRLGKVGVDTDNLLVGIATGMELWRPVSQRMAFGGSIDGGLYGSFARASIEADDGDGRYSAVDDSDLSLAASGTFHLRGRYQLRSWAGLYGGYRWMVITGLASVDDQALPVISDQMTMSTSSDATILFHGFDAGMEFRF